MGEIIFKMNVVDLKKVKINYFLLMIKAFYSILMSSIIIAGNKVIYSGSVFGTYQENYIRSFEFSDCGLLLLIAMIIFIILQLSIKPINFLGNFIIRENNQYFEKIAKKLWITGTIIMIICWIPYVLSYTPGAVYADGFSSIRQALNPQTINNHHPILYTLFVRFLIKIGMMIGDLSTGIQIYTVVQTIIMALILGYTLFWMYQCAVSIKYIVAVEIFYCIFPLFPFYAVALWKDTFFSLAVYLYILILADIVRSQGQLLYNKKGIVKYLILSFLVCFLRNNGIYIVLVCSGIIFIMYRKLILSRIKAFSCSVIIMLALTIIIQGPIYNHFNLNTEFVENLGVAVQQVSRVVALDGEITQKQKEFINKVCTIDDIKAHYTPCLADSFKWYSPSYNGDFLEENKIEFIKVWFSLLRKNPKIYVDAFLLENVGFWSLNTSDSTAYIQDGVWKNNLGIERKDYFKEIFHFSFSEHVVPRKYISAGLLAWMMVTSLVITLCNKKYKYALIYMPVLIAWLTILIATPIAISLRYMYILVLIIPLLPIITLLKPLNRNLA